MKPKQLKLVCGDCFDMLPWSHDKKRVGIVAVSYGPKYSSFVDTSGKCCVILNTDIYFMTSNIMRFARYSRMDTYIRIGKIRNAENGAYYTSSCPEFAHHLNLVITGKTDDLIIRI